MSAGGETRAARRLAAALIVALLWTRAEAATIAVGSSPGAEDLAAQLSEGLCPSFDCVGWPSGQGAAAGPSRRAEGLVLGVVIDGRDGALASVVVRAVPGTERRTWRYPLAADGRLLGDDLRRLARDLQALLDAASPARAAAPPPPAQAPGHHAAPLLTGELGGFLWSRSLGYGGVGPMPGDLLAFKAQAVVGSSLRLRAFPWARAPGAPLERAGLYAEWAASVGLHVRTPSGERRPGSASRVAVGGCWRTPPLGAAAIELSPRLGWLRRTFTVGPAIPGLPDARLSGAAAGLDASAPAWRVRLEGGATAIWWSAAPQLISGAGGYFPGGLAWGVEVEAGFRVPLSRGLSVRLVGQYAATRYRLDADPTGTFVAASARDVSFGALGALSADY